MAEKEKRGKSGSSLRLTNKKHPKIAIWATVLGIFSLLLFFALCIYSGLNHGQAGLFVGAGGILCFVISLIGFILSFISLHKDNVYLRFPTISAVINGILMIFFLLVYLWGLTGSN